MFGDKRKRDIDNYNKLVLDAFEGNVIINDIQIYHKRVRKYHNCLEGMVLVHIHPLETIPSAPNPQQRLLSSV